MHPSSPRTLLPLALLAQACTDPTFQASGAVSPWVSTVLEVDWEPLGGGEAWVEYGPDEAFGMTTPAVPDGEGRSATVLLGNKPFQEVCWRVVAERDGQRITGGTHRTETLGLPAALPDFELVEHDGSFDRWVLGISWAQQTMLYILDRDAEVVWYQHLPEATASLSVDPVPGLPVLRYLRVGMDHELDDSVVVTQHLDGREATERAVEQGHHSFVAHDDGSLAWLAIDVREVEGVGPVVGDRVLRWDAATGETSRLWSSWDHQSYDPEYGLAHDFYPQGADWTHTNSISWSSERGSYELTQGGTDLLIEIDGETGAPLTVVGGEGYALDPPIDGFGDGFGPHGAAWTPEGSLLVFDNNDSDDAEASRVLEYTLDEAAGLAREAWRWEGVPGVVQVLGGADRLADGDTFVHGGSLGTMQLVAEDGRVRWEVHQGSIISDATTLEDLYGRVSGSD